MTTLDECPSVSLHNVAETVPADWTDGGDRLHRLPADVAAELNEMADDRVRHPTGSELRFVPESDDAEIEVTLSADEPGELHVFWGGFQPWKPTDIGPEPTTLTLSVPERLRKLDADRPMSVALGVVTSHRRNASSFAASTRPSDPSPGRVLTSRSARGSTGSPLARSPWSALSRPPFISSAFALVAIESSG